MKFLTLTTVVKDSALLRFLSNGIGCADPIDFETKVLQTSYSMLILFNLLPPTVPSTEELPSLNRSKTRELHPLVTG